MEGKRKPDKRRIIVIILIVVFAGVFVFAGIKLITIMSGYNTATKEYSSVAEKVFEPETDAKGEVIKDSFVWNYQNLVAINPDAVGYLRQKGELKNRVDYPVVQGSDNSYYLKHLINGEYNDSGTLFVDYRIEEGMNAQNCIIYGHNMNNEAMFGCLSDYANETFFKSHPSFDVYIGEDHYLYNVFAFGNVSTTGFAYTYDFTNYDFMEFVRQALEMNTYNTGYTIDDFDYDSKIITLSTCLDEFESSKRYAVFLVRDRKLNN